jgi:mannose-6-phosphate isomerase-like protein (cupin superfamily)
VQLHSTQDGEELLVPLNGSGQVTFTGSKPLAFDKGSALYAPPRTNQPPGEHTGVEPLVYALVYAVSPVEGNQAG